MSTHPLNRGITPRRRPGRVGVSGALPLPVRVGSQGGMGVATRARRGCSQRRGRHDAPLSRRPVRRDLLCAHIQPTLGSDDPKTDAVCAQKAASRAARQLLAINQSIFRARQTPRTYHSGVNTPPLLNLAPPCAPPTINKLPGWRDSTGPIHERARRAVKPAPRRRRRWQSVLNNATATARFFGHP